MTANLILGAVGSVFTLGLLFELMRRHRLREKYAVFWALVAIFTLVIALFPSILFWAADLIGVSVPANLLFFMASMVLLAVSIHHSYEMGRFEDRSRTLAEEIGLLRMELDMTQRALDERSGPGPRPPADG